MTATTCVYPSTTCWKVKSWGLQTYLQFCILIQVLVRFTKSYRREYRLIQKPPILKPQTPIPTIPSFNTSNLSLDPLRRPLTLLRTVTDTNRLYGPYKTSSTHYTLHYTVWRTQASKSAKAKRSKARELTSRP